MNTFFRHPVLRKSLRKEEAWGEVQLFIMGVARELDHLAAVEEWWTDGVECISRTGEKNLRKIDWCVNVMTLSVIQIMH